MDQGILTKATTELINNSEYNTSFETMELIEENDEIIRINPKDSHSTHLIKLNEFIKINIAKNKFNNPYTRNDISFSQEHLELLLKLKKDLIKSIKNIPHELFVDFIAILLFVSTVKQ